MGVPGPRSPFGKISILLFDLCNWIGMYGNALKQVR